MSGEVEIETVLQLQPAWSASGQSDEMALRGTLVRRDIPQRLRGHLDEVARALGTTCDDIVIEGKDSTGYRSRVPWVRLARQSCSPSPREGWYLVYLWAEDGRQVALSLNQGTQLWDGVGLRSRPLPTIERRSTWARRVLTAEQGVRGRLVDTIELGTSSKSRAYAAGNVAAYVYEAGSIPTDEELFVDLLDLVPLLCDLYEAETREPAPGDATPEVAAVEDLVEEIAGRARRRRGVRISAEQRRAIEMRAMEVAADHWRGLGGEAHDVSRRESFDLDVSIGSRRLRVEVKGTVGDGSDIVLTRNEVALHRAAHPDNALAVVSGIALDRSADPPIASGGTLRIWEPWLIEDDHLECLAFQYQLSN